MSRGMPDEAKAPEPLCCPLPPLQSALGTSICQRAQPCNPTSHLSSSGHPARAVWRAVPVAKDLQPGSLSFPLALGGLQWRRTLNVCLALLHLPVLSSLPGRTSSQRTLLIQAQPLTPLPTFSQSTPSYICAPFAGPLPLSHQLLL